MFERALRAEKCVAETVQSFGGFVAKYIGDGVLVYFGYPQAHEDDAVLTSVMFDTCFHLIIFTVAANCLNSRVPVLAGFTQVISASRIFVPRLARFQQISPHSPDDALSCAVRTPIQI